MIPVLWRYLLTHYIKTFLLSVLSFVVLILVIRIKSVASIAALGASSSYVWRYTLFQIPYILPFAVTLSSLLASFFLFQRLSDTCELTALRASGLAFRQIALPLILLATLLAVGNFYVISEISTDSRVQAHKLKKDLQTLNPLTLLQNTEFLKSKGIYIDMDTIATGEKAKDVLLAFVNSQSQRLTLVTAKTLTNEDKHIVADDVSILSVLREEQGTAFNDVIIENQKSLRTPTEDLARYFSTSKLHPSDSLLRLPLLLHKRNSYKDHLADLEKRENISKKRLERVRQEITSPISEIFRRISIAFSVLSLTFMGIAFGSSVSRTKSRLNIILITSLSLLYLVSFFSAKKFHTEISLSFLLYFGPHVILILASIWTLRRVTKGAA